MACASWRASCALTVNLSIFMVANLTQRRVVARRMPPSCRRKLTIAGCQVGQGSAHGTLGVRTGAQRGGVLRPAHDGHVGTGPLQERARNARIRRRGAAEIVGRGVSRCPEDLDGLGAVRRSPL